MRPSLLLAAAFVALAGVGAARAETYAIGALVRPITLDDQHGAPGGVDEGTRLFLVTRDMGGGRVLKEALASTDQAWLDARRIVYVADVSGMPALVTRLFAVPGMRKRAYRVLLDRDGAATRDAPSGGDRVTVLRLDRLRVTEVVEAATAAELRALLDAAPRD